jgi:hypothetical protein
MSRGREQAVEGMSTKRERTFELWRAVHQTGRGGERVTTRARAPAGRERWRGCTEIDAFIHNIQSIDWWGTALISGLLMSVWGAYVKSRLDGSLAVPSATNLDKISRLTYSRP